MGPKNEEDLLAAGYVKGPDGSWRKPLKGVGTGVPITPQESGPLGDGHKLKPIAKGANVRSKKQLNKTEAEFLTRLKAGVYGAVPWIGEHEGVRLELAQRCTYAPDFPTRYEGGEFRFWEVKGGFIREDAWIKLKMAARLYPFWTFVLAQKKDGQWTETIIPP